MYTITTQNNDEDFFWRNLIQASETGEMTNSVNNAMQKNKQKRNK
jgi:hypothetical protein